MSADWSRLLPTSLEVGGVERPIRSDYRAILDICTALSDPELDGQERAEVLLTILYPELEGMFPGDYEQAIEQGIRFINCGAENTPRSFPRLVDWEQDFPYIVAPINRVTGQEIRAVEYMHWWTFLAAYYEIGDCTFAQIVRIRSKLAKGQALDKADREWYHRNRELVDFKHKYTSQEDAVFDLWLK